MSIFNSFKKALGFPDTYDDENDVDSDDADQAERADETGRPKLDLTLPTRAEEIPDSGPEMKHENASRTVEATAGTDRQPESEDNGASTEALASKAFDCVVELFNSIQPDFVKQCLDTEAQRRYITEHIDSSLREALNDATQQAREAGRRQWQAERSRLSSDLDNLRKQYASIKRRSEDFQNAQLSEARQKRALSDRVHDLESQVAALEAEKEQFQIENRSMANKLRASGVLRGVDSSNTAAPDDSETAKELAETKAELEKLNLEATSLRDRCKDLEDELAQNRKERDEMEEEMQKSVEIIDSRIADFENIKKKKDARIAQLSSSLKNAEKRITVLENTVSEKKRLLDEASSLTESLRSTIETNLRTHAEVEHTLRQEINMLRGNGDLSLADPPASYSHAAETPTDNTEIAEVKESKISAIDDLMDNTDWFVAPDPVPLKKDPEVEEQFGYKEPKTRQTRQIDDDKQLSLF